MPHFTQKAKIRDYIKEKHPMLKAIYIELGFYMQNWTSFFKAKTTGDGTVVFAALLNKSTQLHMADVEDTGPVVCEILNHPEKYVGQDICICGEVIQFGDIPKVFTKVTGVPAITNTLTEEEFRAELHFMPKTVQDEVIDMLKWFQDYGYYGKEKDWTTGKKLTKLNTFEQWLKKVDWKGQ